MIKTVENQAPTARNDMRPEHIPEQTGTASNYGIPSLIELPALRFVRPHYAVRKEVLEHMNPIAKMTAELCIARGTWELIE
ncbi:MAG: hypothetical protein WCJ93_10855 [Methanomicrobiales archaeon]|jgi:hypothetical protein